MTVFGAFSFAHVLQKNSAKNALYQNFQHFTAKIRSLFEFWSPIPFTPPLNYPLIISYSYQENALSHEWRKFVVRIINDFSTTMIHD